MLSIRQGNYWQAIKPAFESKGELSLLYGIQGLAAQEVRDDSKRPSLIDFIDKNGYQPYHINPCYT